MRCLTQSRTQALLPILSAEVLASHLLEGHFKPSDATGLVHFESQWDLLNLVEVFEQLPGTTEFLYESPQSYPCLALLQMESPHGIEQLHITYFDIPAKGPQK